MSQPPAAQVFETGTPGVRARRAWPTWLAPAALVGFTVALVLVGVLHTPRTAPVAHLTAGPTGAPIAAPSEQPAEQPQRDPFAPEASAPSLSPPVVPPDPSAVPGPPVLPQEPTPWPAPPSTSTGAKALPTPAPTPGVVPPTPVLPGPGADSGPPRGPRGTRGSRGSRGGNAGGPGANGGGFPGPNAVGPITPPAPVNLPRPTTPTEQLPGAPPVRPASGWNHPPALPGERLELTAVIQGADPQAVFRYQGKYFRKSPDEHVGDFKLLAIGDGRVLLGHDSQRYWLPLSQAGRAGDKPTAPPAAEPAAPAVVSGPADEPAAPDAGRTPGTPRPGGTPGRPGGSGRPRRGNFGGPNAGGGSFGGAR